MSCGDAPAVRAALDLAVTPDEEQAAVAARAEEDYGVTMEATSENAVMPYLPTVPVVIVEAGVLAEQLRDFRRTVEATASQL